jgi:hypothetical protein
MKAARHEPIQKYVGETGRIVPMLMCVNARFDAPSLCSADSQAGAWESVRIGIYTIFYRSHAPALVVIHKSLKSRHSGRDCRKPEHRDVNARNQAISRCKACRLLRYCHPWLLGNCSMHCSTSCIPAVVDPSNPCRDDGVHRHLCITTSAPAWECRIRRSSVVLNQVNV